MGFCNNCGNKLNGEKFCTKCGARVDDVNTEPSGTYPIFDGHYSNTKNKGLFCKIGLGAGLLVIVIALIFIFSGRSCDGLIDDFVDASLSGDAEKIISLMPESMVDYIAKTEYDGDKEEMIYDLEDNLDRFLDKIDDSGIKTSDISYEIKDSEDMDEDDIADINKEYRRAKLDVKEGKKIDIKVKVQMDGNEMSNTLSVNAVKIGRSWYLLYR